MISRNTSAKYQVDKGWSAFLDSKGMDQELYFYEASSTRVKTEALVLLDTFAGE